MANTKAFNRNIGVQIGDLSKQLLKVGYTQDGSYWIQDLIRPKGEASRCGVIKIASHQKNHGRRTSSALYQAFTSGNVKLSHHLSGKAQISGKGVISGYDERGNPRGAAISSFLLSESNDGGMAFGFLTWGIDCHPRNTKEGDIINQLPFNISRKRYPPSGKTGYAVCCRWKFQSPAERRLIRSSVFGKRLR